MTGFLKQSHGHGDVIANSEGVNLKHSSSLSLALYLRISYFKSFSFFQFKLIHFQLMGEKSLG